MPSPVFAEQVKNSTFRWSACCCSREIRLFCRRISYFAPTMIIRTSSCWGCALLIVVNQLSRERIDFELDRSHTTSITFAFLMYEVARLAYFSCPAVSQSSSYLSSMWTFKHETLIVGGWLLNWSNTARCINDVFPLEESPNSTILIFICVEVTKFLSYA